MLFPSLTTKKLFHATTFGQTIECLTFEQGFKSVGPYKVRDDLRSVSDGFTQFTSKAMDMDFETNTSCAHSYNTAGWIKNCINPTDFISNLFGLNFHGLKRTDDSLKSEKGIFWKSFGGTQTSLSKVIMSIKPKGSNVKRNKSHNSNSSTTHSAGSRNCMKRSKSIFGCTHIHYRPLCLVSINKKVE